MLQDSLPPSSREDEHSWASEIMGSRLKRDLLQASLTENSTLDVQKDGLS